MSSGIKRMIIFSSNAKDLQGGGGVRHIERAVRKGFITDTEVVGIVSTRRRGGAAAHAHELHIPFLHFKEPFNPPAYARMLEETGAEWAALIGWNEPVYGLDPRRTFGVHLAPLPVFGGNKDTHHGDSLQLEVYNAFASGELQRSAVTMYFATNGLHKGPIIFEAPVPIFPVDAGNPRRLHNRAVTAGRMYSPDIIQAILHEQIRWDGINPSSLVVPGWVRTYAQPHSELMDPRS